MGRVVDQLTGLCLGLMEIRGGRFRALRGRAKQSSVRLEPFDALRANGYQRGFAE